MSIGSFARRSGLTASALRFYADSGLLLPAKVDPTTGYRSYQEAQLEPAVLLRQLREIGMPLMLSQSVLDADHDEADRLIDTHVNAVVDDALAVRRQAARIRASLAPGAASHVASLRGPVLTAAIEQVLTATTHEPDFAVLNGVHFDVAAGAVILTATDRYRLSIRTLVSAEAAPVNWAATVNADDLRGHLPDLRRASLVRIDASDHGIWMRLRDRDDLHCRLLAEPFPDYQLMLAGLTPATTRVEVSKAVLLRAIEERSADHIVLHVEQDAVTVSAIHRGQHGGTRLSARVTGPSTEVFFEMATLYPALSTAIGADVLLDLRGPGEPATIRSADHGDLTTLVMPVKPPLGERDTDTKERDT